MALPDDEQRRLAEIERALAEDDPRLARRLGHGRQPVSSRSLAALITGSVLMLGTGLVIIVVGAGLGTPMVSVIGVVIAVIVPSLAWTSRRYGP